MSNLSKHISPHGKAFVTLEFKRGPTRCEAKLFVDGLMRDQRTVVHDKFFQTPINQPNFHLTFEQYDAWVWPYEEEGSKVRWLPVLEAGG